MCVCVRHLLCLHLDLSIYLSIYLPTYLPAYLPTYLPTYRPTYLSILFWGFSPNSHTNYVQYVIFLSCICVSKISFNTYKEFVFENTKTNYAHFYTIRITWLINFDLDTPAKTKLIPNKMSVACNVILKSIECRINWWTNCVISLCDLTMCVS